MTSKQQRRGLAIITPEQQKQVFRTLRITDRDLWPESFTVRRGRLLASGDTLVIMECGCAVRYTPKGPLLEGCGRHKDLDKLSGAEAFRAAQAWMDL